MPPPYSMQGCLYEVQGQKPSVPGSELGLTTGFGQSAVYFAAGANTYLTEDGGSCLAEVSEQMCVKKSLKWGYPCAVPAESPRAALLRLHPLPTSSSGVGGSFESSICRGNLSCSLPCAPGTAAIASSDSSCGNRGLLSRFHISAEAAQGRNAA